MQSEPTTPETASRSDAQTYRFAAQSDQLFGSVNFDVLTPRQRALLIGAIIIDRHCRAGTPQRLQAIQTTRRNAVGTKPRGSSASFMLLVSMARAGSIDEQCAGLMVDVERESLADAVGLKEKSTYNVVRDLEQIGAIQRIKVAGNKPEKFVLVIPPPMAEDDPDEVQALLWARACPIGAGSNGRSARPQLDLARAHSEGFPYGASKRAPTEKVVSPNPPFQAENASAAVGARAHRESERHDMNDVCNDHHHGAEDGEENAREMLAALTFEEGKPLDPPGIRRMLSSRTCTPERIRLAYRITMDKPRQRPRAYFYTLVMQPELRDDQIDIEAAQHRREDAAFNAQAKKALAKEIHRQPDPLKRSAMSKAATAPDPVVMREGLAKCMAAINKSPPPGRSEQKDPPSAPAAPVSVSMELSAPEAAAIEHLRTAMLLKKQELPGTPPPAASPKGNP